MYKKIQTKYYRYIKLRKYNFLVLQILVILMLTACSSTQNGSSTLPASNHSVAAATATVTTSVEANSLITPTRISTTSPNLITKSSAPENWQIRWLKSIPCRPPCWEGITPGLTTASKAVEILKQSPIVVNTKIGVDRLLPELGYVVWNWIGNEKGEKGDDGEANYDARTPEKLLYVIHPRYDIAFNLKDIMQAYGEPSHVIATAFPNPDINSGLTYSIKIVYINQGFALDMGVISKDGSNKPTLSADLSLTRPDFFVPSVDGFATAYKGLQPQPKLLVPWQGFKSFDFYCRDPSGDGSKDCSGIK